MRTGCKATVAAASLAALAATADAELAAFDNWDQTVYSFSAWDFEPLNPIEWLDPTMPPLAQTGNTYEEGDDVSLPSRAIEARVYFPSGFLCNPDPPRRVQVRSSPQAKGETVKFLTVEQRIEGDDYDYLADGCGFVDWSYTGALPLEPDATVGPGSSDWTSAVASVWIDAEVDRPAEYAGDRWAFDRMPIGIRFQIDGETHYGFLQYALLGNSPRLVAWGYETEPDTPVTVPDIRRADLDFDFDVDANDLGMLIAAWGQTGAFLREDLDDDEIVGASDLGVLIAAWD